MIANEYLVLFICSEIYAGRSIESTLTVHGCNDRDSRIDHLEHVQVRRHSSLLNWPLSIRSSNHKATVSVRLFVRCIYNCLI